MVIDTRRLIFARVQLFVDFIAKQHGRLDIQKETEKNLKNRQTKLCGLLT